jgi:hypothetical protein
MQPNLVLAGLCGEDFFYSSPKHSIGKTTSHFQGGFYLTLTIKLQLYEVTYHRRILKLTHINPILNIVAEKLILPIYIKHFGHPLCITFAHRFLQHREEQTQTNQPSCITPDVCFQTNTYFATRYKSRGDGTFALPIRVGSILHLAQDSDLR